MFAMWCSMPMHELIVWVAVGFLIGFIVGRRLR